MNRIAGRSGIALLLVLVLIGGLVFFVGEYFLEADDWINAAGSPHVYNGGNIGCGVVLDREGELLLDISEERIYPDSLALRKSVIHWLGDREGNISAPALPNYSDALSGFDLFNGIYSFSGTQCRSRICVPGLYQCSGKCSKMLRIYRILLYQQISGRVNLRGYEAFCSVAGGCRRR